ncbi:MAG: TonB-dependent receptor [Terriglobia bacterium]|jgi:iron complex outermembrane receptor protein
MMMMPLAGEGPPHTLLPAGCRKQRESWIAAAINASSAWWVGAALWALLLGPITASAQSQKPPSTDLAEASLEDLMNIQVTSVSRKQQKMSKVAAAIYVITQEDIQRSGATTIPDLLRMVPGLDVAQIDANSWAISSRGFNDPVADKLLVLIDGRSVYDPTFSGVYWDQQNVPLEDIDRIEVIRGPGATVWGANAVNGVISIITKSSQATQGGLVTAGEGSSEAHELVQYGGKIGRSGTYRIFGSYDNYNNHVDEADQPAEDAWHLTHVGFRSDWGLTPRDALTVEGDIIAGRERQVTPSFISLYPLVTITFDDPIRPGAGDILGRWTHTFSGRSDTALQVYYDGVNRTDYGVRELSNTFDLDFQHHLALGSRQDVVWGFEYRHISESILPGYSISVIPPSLSQNLSSAFFQDEIKLADSLNLTLGSKIEHNSYTGFEVEPSGRFAWSPVDRQTLWGAVSRAIRQPAPADEDLRDNQAAYPGPGELNTLLSIFGNPNFKSEVLLAYELGYRVEPIRRVSLDFATFYNIYHDLRTLEPGTPSIETTPPPPYLLVPEVFGNGAHGQTFGAEASADWSVVNRWKLTGSYSWLNMRLQLDPSSHDTSSATAAAGQSPRHQFQVRSYLTLPRRFDFDSSLYYVDRLPALNTPAYTRVDARLAWHPTESIELSVVGQNLLDERHFEFIDAADQLYLSSQVKRSVYGKITWRFK